MYKKINRSLIILILLFSNLSFVFSQFEQKITLNVSLGYIRPVGIGDYIKVKTENPSRLYAVDGTGTTEFVYIYPYIMSNFDPGLAINGGIQININRRFSIAGNIGYFNLWSWSYEYTYNIIGSGEYTGDWLSWEITGADVGEEPEDEVLVSGENEYNLYNLNIGVFPKIYLAPGKSFNPFLFTGLTLNYTSLNYQDNESVAYNDYEGYESDWNPLSNMIDKSVGFGFYPGLGFDIKMNDNMGLFIQGGYSVILLNQSELEENGLDPENFQTFKLEAGLKLSFLKSKNL